MKLADGVVESLVADFDGIVVSLRLLRFQHGLRIASFPGALAPRATEGTGAA